MPCSVIALPKSIDNDFLLLDKTFGWVGWVGRLRLMCPVMVGRRPDCSLSAFSPCVQVRDGCGGGTEGKLGAAACWGILDGKPPDGCAAVP